MRGVRPHRRAAGSDGSRSGSVTLEFILAACIWFITFLAIFEFAFLMLTLQVGHTALIEGARRTAELYPPDYPVDLAGFDNDIADQVVEKMNEHLGVHCLEIFDSTQGLVDNPERANAQVIIERGDDPPIMRGDAVAFPMGFTCTAAGALPTSEEIRVTLCFPLVDSSDPSGCGNPVPDWLAMFGFTLESCVYQVSSRMLLE